MTYNEWRDELKNNLLTVSDAERRRVLDYYAEAYADRREAGYTEREIIEGFGAPYDAAQRILNESSDDYYRQEPSRKDTHQDNTDRRGSTSYEQSQDSERASYDERDISVHEERRKRHQQQSTGNRSDALFVLLCVVLAIPIFAVIMSMIGITIGLLVAPFGVIISGFGTLIAGVGTLFHSLLSGILAIGEGFIVIGVGTLLIPLCILLSKWMWKLLRMFFEWLKQLVSNKEKAQ